MKTTVTQFAPMAILGVGVLMISGMREQYVMPPVLPMATITRSLSGHTGTDVTVAEEERRVAGMSDYMLRTFGPDSAPLFTTYVGYYDRQVQGKTIHSPKNCLPGAGWEVLSSEAVPVPGRTGSAEKINRVLLANKSARALVYYWYQGRGRIESNEYRVKWDLLRDAALRGRTEEALVRIVVPLPPDGSLKGRATEQTVAEAQTLADHIVTELVPAVDKVLPPFSAMVATAAKE